MTELVAHVVRDYGGLTEPFIEHRLTAEVAGYKAHLWVERLRTESPVPKHHVDSGWLRPGTLPDRVFFRMPILGSRLSTRWAKALESEHPDLLHAHYLSSAYLAGVRTKTPLIVSAYGFDLSILPRRRAWSGIFRAMPTRVSRLLVEGPHMRDTAIGLGFREDQVVIVPISAGFDDIPFAPAGADRGESLRILACGRFVEKKGHELAIEAFQRIAPDLPAGSELVVVGSGPRDSRLRALATSNPAIRFTGSLPRADYLKLLRSSNLFVAPSRMASNGDTEGGAPTTILDAQASGTIVIGSRHADIPHIVRDSETGYLCDEGSSERLIAAIRRALNDRDAWPAVREQARARVIANHSDAAVAAHLKRVYDACLDA